MGFDVRLMPTYDPATGMLMGGSRQLAQVQDVHLLRGRFGGDLILIASGPSVDAFPLERYSQVDWVMMNGSVALLDRIDHTPFLYICDDPSFVRDRPELALRGLQTAEFAAMSLDCLGELEIIYPGCLVSARIIVLERANRVGRRPVVSDRRYSWSVRNDPDIECGFSLFKRKTNRIGFSRNLAKGYFGARTIPYAGLQIAFHLGFKRVFMVGVDLDPGGGRFYEQGEQALPSTLDADYSHYILPSFRLMAQRVLKPGVFEVFNLSPSKRLPASVIPRLSPDELDAMLSAASG
ncbi:MULTISPECIES: hypothetical protein [Halopseudomonas]|jgi:KDO transferase-3|uniref:hypothetical protein n=1 Tax=Halopseudomonas TaxID=2901189 RepID=UPI0022B5F56B|nr:MULTISPECIES: hypothetical protein [Halopseudomonas]BDX17343.1 LPS biosynthesis protein [Halopseudomonas aestusnigri]GMQ53318.1 LPS biosynthesis protein [Halopseudomonas aestusnigri]